MTQEITLDEYRALTRAKRAGKYRNRRTETSDGHMADSAMEARRWETLRLMERAGAISDLEFHPRYTLAAGIVYEADAGYTENGRRIAEDTKGVQTKEFRLKARLFAEAHPDIELRLWRG